MFYKKGIDITNDKQMFNFLKNHFTYYTMNSWNLLESIANNVKLYNLGLSGNCDTVLALLEASEYDTIGFMIADWEKAHPGYRVIFNGRSYGYLVLTSVYDARSILPDEINEAEDYEEYKRYCKEFYGSVKDNRDDLRFYTKLVQDFDKLCDELRDFCDRLSKCSYESAVMEKAVNLFNNMYAADLDYLGFDELSFVGFGAVDVSEIRQLDCLLKAFLNCITVPEGYVLDIDKDGVVSLVK